MHSFTAYYNFFFQLYKWTIQLITSFLYAILLKAVLKLCCNFFHTCCLPCPLPCYNCSERRCIPVASFVWEVKICRKGVIYNLFLLVSHSGFWYGDEPWNTSVMKYLQNCMQSALIRWLWEDRPGRGVITHFHLLPRLRKPGRILLWCRGLLSPGEHLHDVVLD
jgi:hypothetical protein